MEPRITREARLEGKRGKEDAVVLGNIESEPKMCVRSERGKILLEVMETTIK